MRLCASLLACLTAALPARAQADPAQMTYIPVPTAAVASSSGSKSSNKGKITGDVLAALTVLLALLPTTLYITRQRSKNSSTHWRNCVGGTSRCVFKLRRPRPPKRAQLSLWFSPLPPPRVPFVLPPPVFVLAAPVRCGGYVQSKCRALMPSATALHALAHGHGRRSCIDSPDAIELTSGRGLRPEAWDEATRNFCVFLSVSLSLYAWPWSWPGSVYLNRNRNRFRNRIIRIRTAIELTYVSVVSTRSLDLGSAVNRFASDSDEDSGSLGFRLTPPHSYLTSAGRHKSDPPVNRFR
ncbi:hypothetical protein B0H13DRAFT_1916898 [Mycena leptocephala]|nr:hypothetical protein B0H13DRAFT_1916898 [Mycena leptocephala]